MKTISDIIKEINSIFRSLELFFGSIINFRILILFFLCVRILFLMQVFTVTPDTAVNINLASNILKGNWFQIHEFQANGLISSRPYFDHPPATAVLMSVFIFFADNEIVGLFFTMIFLTICELCVVNYILNLKVFRNNRKLLFLAIALYTGHLYTGSIADQFAMVLAMFVFSNLMYLFEQRKETSSIGMVVLSISLILIPLVKFSLIPLVFGSYFVMIWYLNGSNLDRKSSKKLFLFSTLTFGLTVFLFLYLQSMSSMSLNQGGFNCNINIYDLCKVDYFWMHLGKYIDRVYKHLMWNIDRVFIIHIDFWNIAQILTFTIWCVLFVRVRILNDLSFKMLMFMGFIQTGYLALLTVITPPQENVLYGVDDKVWVYIEEARYYNYLAFFFFIMLANKLVNMFKMSFYFLIFLLFVNLTLECVESRFACRLMNINNCADVLRNNSGSKSAVQGKLTIGEIRSIRIMLGYEKY